MSAGISDNVGFFCFGMDDDPVDEERLDELEHQAHLRDIEEMEEARRADERAQLIASHADDQWGCDERENDELARDIARRATDRPTEE